MPQCTTRTGSPAEVETRLLEVRTGGHQTVVDLTEECVAFLAEVGAQDGLLNVFVPHATAGVAVLEFGAGSEGDLLATLEALLPPAGPQRAGWRHQHGSPGHGRDHVLPALVSPSVVLPVVSGALALGTWQRVGLVDTNRDNHVRTVRLSYLPG
jgi:secondary thiamine-phosphate synthase enzyme